MHTDTTPKEKPTGCANNPAGHTDSQILPYPAGAGNDFANLTVRFALVGYTFRRSNPADSAGLYYAALWIKGRTLPDLQTAAQFMAQIGGGNV